MADGSDTPSILGLARSDAYTFSKVREPSLRLIAGQGVEGDVHCGETVKHRSRIAADPTRPNLRQVHLIQGELSSELREKGFEVGCIETGDAISVTLPQEPHRPLECV